MNETFLQFSRSRSRENMYFKSFLVYFSTRGLLLLPLVLVYFCCSNCVSISSYLPNNWVVQQLLQNHWMWEVDFHGTDTNPLRIKIPDMRFFVRLETVSLQQVIARTVVQNFKCATTSTGNCCRPCNNSPHIQSLWLQYHVVLVPENDIYSDLNPTGRKPNICIPLAILTFAEHIGPASSVQQQSNYTWNLDWLRAILVLVLAFYNKAATIYDYWQ